VSVATHALDHSCAHGDSRGSLFFFCLCFFRATTAATHRLFTAVLRALTFGFRGGGGGKIQFGNSRRVGSKTFVEVARIASSQLPTGRSQQTGLNHVDALGGPVSVETVALGVEAERAIPFVRIV